jgi:hypothetical protein
MGMEHITATGAFAFGMLLVIGMGCGVILTLFLSMRHHSKRVDSEVDDLIQEVSRQERVSPITAPTKPPDPPPWERSADWWKNHE